MVELNKLPQGCYMLREYRNIQQYEKRDGQADRVGYICNGQHRQVRNRCAPNIINETEIDGLIYDEISRIKDLAKISLWFVIFLKLIHIVFICIQDYFAIRVESEGEKEQ